MVEPLDAVSRHSDVPVRRRPTRRRGEDQRDLSGDIVQEVLGEPACVVAQDEGLTGPALRFRLDGVACCEDGPSRLKLDADRPSVEMDGLDEGRADPAHRGDDEVASLAVALDRRAGEGGVHLAWVS